MLTLELKLTLIDQWSSCRLPTSAFYIEQRQLAIAGDLAIAKIRFSRVEELRATVCVWEKRTLLVGHVTRKYERPFSRSIDAFIST